MFHFFKGSPVLGKVPSIFWQNAPNKSMFKDKWVSAIISFLQEKQELFFILNI